MDGPSVKDSWIWPTYKNFMENHGKWLFLKTEIYRWTIPFRFTSCKLLELLEIRLKNLAFCIYFYYCEILWFLTTATTIVSCRCPKNMRLGMRAARIAPQTFPTNLYFFIGAPRLIFSLMILPEKKLSTGRA